MQEQQVARCVSRVTRETYLVKKSLKKKRAVKKTEEGILLRESCMIWRTREAKTVGTRKTTSNKRVTSSK